VGVEYREVIMEHELGSRRGVGEAGVNDRRGR